MSMNKIITIFLIVLYLSANTSASCTPADLAKCTPFINPSEDVKTHLYSDEIDIIVRVTNKGTEECIYKVGVVAMGETKPIEVEPNFFFWLNPFIKHVKPGESDTITLTSSYDREWDACSLQGNNPGEGNFSLRVWSMDRSGTVCETAFGTYFTFEAPSGCCGKFEGITCFDYNFSYGGFTCNESVQINENKSCLVNCIYKSEGWWWFKKANCSCVLEDACAINCITGNPSYCEYGYFVCAGPHYRCPGVGGSAAEPEVMCSTTKNCKFQCAAKCGRQTTCVRDCERCCKQTTCNKVLPYPYEKYELDACMDACLGICKTHEELCNLIHILGGIAVAASVFLIMVHGLKWMTAEDSEGRDNARRGIIYVFIGLILVMVAATLASYFFTGSLVC